MNKLISKSFYVVLFALAILFGNPASGQSVVVNINTATQVELETLPGIGPAKAFAILEYRQSIGAFTDIEQLDNVPGIGPATMESIRPLVILVGPVEEIPNEN